MFAAAPSINNTPSSINVDTDFSLTVSMDGLSNNSIYRLRITLAAPGTNDYFGSTFNGSSWYNGTPSPINYANFLSITTDSSGHWSDDIQGKVESSDPNFRTRGGIHELKVGRYTETGSSATWSNIVQVTIVAPTPSPTPISTSTPVTSLANSSSIFTISNVPSKINYDQPFTVKVTLSIPTNPNTEYYLKGAFKHTNSTRYLGFTKKDSDWIEYGDDYSDQYKITTDSSGNWTGDLEAKPDTFDNDYKGPGDYIFKIGRLTSSGYGPTWSNETTIKIEGGNDPTPTPTLKPSLSPTAYSTPQAKSPAPSSTLKPTPRTSSIAGVATSFPSPSIEVKNQKHINLSFWIGSAFVFAGAGTIGYIYWKKKHETIS